MYTVKQLSQLADVTVRTLHYYDEIDLLKPSKVGDNGYRYYADEAVYTLQQILLYREMGLSLHDINAIIHMDEFDMLAALQAHRIRLRAKIRRLNDLVDTVNTTILHLMEDIDMSKKKLFKGFSKEDEKRYEQEARERWGDESVGASYKLWNSYSPEKQEAIKSEGGAIYHYLASVMDKGPASPEAQEGIANWHQHMRYFYEPSVERLRGLGQLYVESPDFTATIGGFHKDLPGFMQQAINYYCDKLEASPDGHSS